MELQEEIKLNNFKAHLRTVKQNITAANDELEKILSEKADAAKDLLRLLLEKEELGKEIDLLANDRAIILRECELEQRTISEEKKRLIQAKIETKTLVEKELTAHQDAARHRNFELERTKKHIAELQREQAKLINYNKDSTNKHTRQVASLWRS